MSQSKTAATWCIGFLCLLLAGCAVDERDIEMGTKICQDHNGILFLLATGDKVTCKDNFQADYSSIKRRRNE